MGPSCPHIFLTTTTTDNYDSYIAKHLLQLMLQQYTRYFHLFRETDELRRQPLHDVTESAVNQDPHVSPSDDNVVFQSHIFYGHHHQIHQSTRSKWPVCAEQPQSAKPNKCTYPIITGQQPPANAELETRQQSPIVADKPNSIELESGIISDQQTVQSASVVTSENDVDQHTVQCANYVLEYQQSCNPELQLLDLSDILAEALNELFSDDLDQCREPLANSSLCRAFDVMIA